MRNQKSVTQKRCKVERFLREHERLLRQQGAVVETWRDYQGRRLGPYYRLVCREAGRQRTFYLGTDPELVAEVRRRLKQLQSPGRDERHLRRQRQIMRRELARCRAAWQRELKRVGLSLRGRHVCGWRSRKFVLFDGSREREQQGTPTPAAAGGHERPAPQAYVQPDVTADG